MTRARWIVVIVAAAIAVTAAAATAGSVPSWHPVPAQGPRGGIGQDELNVGNMTCESRTECVLAGALENPGTQAAAPLLWHYNGRSWRRDPVAGGNEILDATACATRSSCWAVGGRGPANVDLQSSPALSPAFAHFNGRSWSAVRGLAGARGVGFNGIACPAARLCLAVGTDVTSTTTAHAVAARWTGGVWRLVRVPAPRGAIWSVLTSVTCLTSTHCTAFGDALNSLTGSGYFFGERFNGQRWSLFSIPYSRKFDLGNQTGLFASGCITSSLCLAGGGALGYTNGAQGADFAAGLAVGSRSSSWHQLRNLPGSGALVTGVSCLMRIGCWVTFSPSGPVDPVGSPITVAFWNGSRFAVSTQARDGALDAISCLPSGWCMGFGQGAGATRQSPPVVIAEVRP